MNVIYDRNGCNLKMIGCGIIKINEDNSIAAISDNSIASLAYGKNIDYSKSSINKWLNVNDEIDNSGILEKQLNGVEKYLQKTITCLDKIDTISNQPCKSTDDSNYLSLLSTIDFANIGNKKSFVMNGEYFYLNDQNNANKVWYITEDEKISLSNGDDIIGIRPVITIKANIDYIDGDGTKDNPYIIEKENGLFGSYVKLGNDIWRIYEKNDSYVKLMLNDYIKTNDTIVTHNYSANNSYHDDTVYGSLAYYLNNTYLNSLPYKNYIKERNWSNGYYNNESNYDYNTSLSKEVNTKVALMSIGNIFLNPNVENYFTMTGTSNRSSVMYTMQKNKKIYTKSVHSKINIVPTISLDTDMLKKGKGTLESPYEME